jgi:hypothetical protein
MEKKYRAHKKKTDLRGYKELFSSRFFHILIVSQKFGEISHAPLYFCSSSARYIAICLCIPLHTRYMR